ncbi:unnamed protein product [Peronospora farinosa]|nr:unnamed protein product [Peronospora farinosa]
MFLGYGVNTKGYRVYDLELNKVKISRSVKLDEREVNGIYSTSTMTEKTEVINVIKDIEEVAQPENEKEHPVEDEPMESTADPFEDVEMQEDEHEPISSGRELTTYHRQHELTANGDMVFRPERERSRRPREPSLLLGNGLIMADENTMNSDDDPDNDDHFYPPSPKRPRIDEDNLLAEAVLAYAASIGDANDAPTTYQQAMDSDEVKEWVKAMSAELKAHSENGSWSLVPKMKNVRIIGCRIQAEVRCRFF